MGVKGKRPIKRQLDIEEPQLIIGVDSIIEVSKERGYIVGGKVDIFSIVEDNNIHISYEEMDSSFSGYLRYMKGEWVIGVNKKHNAKRQRFTVAHEFAHFQLHRNKNNQVDFEDTTFFRSDNMSSIEFAANEFAARLLMPEIIVREFIGDGVNSLMKLAEIFDVSVDAMRYRISSLGYKTKSNE